MCKEILYQRKRTCNLYQINLWEYKIASTAVKESQSVNSLVARGLNELDKNLTTL